MGLRGQIGADNHAEWQSSNIQQSSVRWIESISSTVNRMQQDNTGESHAAARYWVDKHVQIGNPIYAVPGVLASSWASGNSARPAEALAWIVGAETLRISFGSALSKNKKAIVPPTGGFLKYLD